jgi:hypothetical protein
VERRRFSARCALIGAFALHSLQAFAAAEPQLDSITVQAKREHEKLQRDVDEFVGSAIVHTSDRPLLRWHTPVCPLVAGLPREQGEFMLRRLSEAVRNAGAPLAPEACKANLLVLISSEPGQLLESLRRKRPQLFDVFDGMGTLKHFLRTDRPVRVWYNWRYVGDTAAFSTAATITGTNAPSAAGDAYPVLTSPNSRLSYSGGRSIDSAIVAVDLPQLQGVNFGQLSDYVAMVGLAEINLDKEVTAAPSVLRLFNRDGGAPAEGMSIWDRELLKSLYSSRAADVMQVSAMKTQMVDSIARH